MANELKNISIDEIYKLHKAPLTDSDKGVIARAYDFAKEAHEGQSRQSGEPYFNHVVETAKNLSRYDMDADTISAGLLHDTIEDGRATEDQIKKNFNSDIVFLIDGVTKLGKVKYHGAERHAESLRKFFMAIAQDYRVLMIKLADRLHNLQTLEYVKPEKRKRIALESLEVYAPLAHRLGLGRLKGEIEDTAFPYVYPKEYEEVSKLLETRTKENKENLDKIAKELSGALKNQNVDVVKMSERVKHKYSLWIKLKRYNNDIEKIYDLVALRVIVPTIEDCYKSLGIIHSLWRPLPGRIKDYIALPKVNGYQSLQTTIFTGDGGITEIQIRTPQMDARAEYGVASHFAYKENQKKEKDEEKFKWVNEFKKLHENHDGVKGDEFLKNIKMDLSLDRIFVFTPKGDVVDLPIDASPIDFAYAIHSEIGDKANACTINGKYSKLFTKLKSGDIVKIETKKDSKPSSKWLDYTKTTLAKRHIKQALDAEGGIINSIMKRFR